MNLKGGYFIQEKGKPIDLWQKDIEWHDCPEDLLEALRLVEIVREWGEDKFSDPYLSDCVHVSGQYVIVSNGHWISRSILSTPAPFDMAIYPGPTCQHYGNEENLFSKMQDDYPVLARVAYFDVAGENGLAFDFGDHRGWCCSRPSDYKKDLVKKVNRLFKGRVTKIMEEPTKEMIELVYLFRENVDHNFCDRKNNPLTVTINNNKIHFLYKTENMFWEKDRPLTTDCPVHSMSFEVDPLLFNYAVESCYSMAIIRNEVIIRDFLYFEDNSGRDHLLECNVKELKMKN